MSAPLCSPGLRRLLRLARRGDRHKYLFETSALLLDVNGLLGLAECAIEDMHRRSQLHRFAGLWIVHEAHDHFEGRNGIHAGKRQNLVFRVRGLALWITRLAFAPKPRLIWRGRKDFDLLIHVLNCYHFAPVFLKGVCRATTNQRARCRRGPPEDRRRSAGHIAPGCSAAQRVGRTIDTSQSSSWRRQPQP